jgi:hypothetical protein
LEDIPSVVDVERSIYGNTRLVDLGFFVSSYLESEQPDQNRRKFQEDCRFLLAQKMMSMNLSRRSSELLEILHKLRKQLQ